MLRVRHKRGMLFVSILLTLYQLTYITDTKAQEAGAPQQLERVDVTPPERTSPSRPATAPQGFGYDQPMPTGQERTDFPLAPSQVVSPTGRLANLATVPSAITVVENQGIAAQGRTGLVDMVTRTPGTYAGGYSTANMFNAQIGMRGFFATPASINRTAIILEGRNMEIPRSEADTGFLFPEIIDRVEVMRGDGTVQFGNKAIGGSLNVLLKKPRQNPGTYFGIEGRSWYGQREWAATNVVRGPLAAGIFCGMYSEQGYRVYGGDGQTEEFVGRPGPWELFTAIPTLNWKITPRLTCDVTYVFSRERMAAPDDVKLDRWERRDTRDVSKGRADGGADERWDRIALLSLYYDGDILGNLEIKGMQRYYDTNSYAYLFAADFGREVQHVRWADFGLSLKYARTDEFLFIHNELTLGTDVYDGFYGRGAKEIVGDGSTYKLSFKNETSTYRESLGYYVINQSRFWDRIIVTLGHRVEHYDFKDLYFENRQGTGRVKREYYPMNKSASQASLGFVYDRELGSSVYVKHARTYRFPTISEMINTGRTTTSHPQYIYFLEPEEGTLEEAGIRHWFTPNIYASLIYYELEMDSELLGEWDTRLNPPPRWNANVPLVAHDGIEFESMVRLTPRWTLNGNYTKQRVYYRTDNINPLNMTQGRLTDKWVPPNPHEMYNLWLTYENTDWGFAASISYRYIGSRYFQGDDFNVARDLEPVRIGDLAISQTFFDGLATLYFGIKNFNDQQSSLASYYYISISGNNAIYQYYPDAGRTYYLGVRSTLDFDRMRVPTSADLERMHERLYGALERGINSLAGVPGRIGNVFPFQSL